MKEPTIYRPPFHDDDRRRAVNDLFPLDHGQINVSNAYPGVTVAWHRHQQQTDYWFCIKGSFKVGLCHNNIVRWEYLNEYDRKVLVIPPGHWHGYKNLSDHESTLLYWVTKRYDSVEPDEERTTVGSFGESWDTRAR